MHVMAGQLCDLDAVLEVPSSSSVEDLRVMIKLCKMDHEPSNMQIALSKSTSFRLISNWSM